MLSFELSSPVPERGRLILSVAEQARPLQALADPEVLAPCLRAAPWREGRFRLGDDWFDVAQEPESRLRWARFAADGSDLGSEHVRVELGATVPCGPLVELRGDPSTPVWSIHVARSAAKPPKGQALWWSPVAGKATAETSRWVLHRSEKLPSLPDDPFDWTLAECLYAFDFDRRTVSWEHRTTAYYRD